MLLQLRLTQSPQVCEYKKSTLGATMVETVIDQKSNFKTKEGEK